MKEPHNKKVGNNHGKYNPRIYKVPYQKAEANNLNIKEYISNQIKLYYVPYEEEKKETYSKISNQLKEEINQKILKACQLHSEGKILEAEKYYKDILDQDIIHPSVLTNYGLINSSKGKNDKAKELYMKSIKYFPDKPDAYINMGQLQNKLNKNREALEYLVQAIRIKPDCAESHLILSNIFSDLNQENEAKISINKAIELKPDNAEAFNTLGSINQKIGNVIEAEKDYRKAIKLNPDIAAAYANLGGILKSRGEYKEAEKYILKAIKIQPNSKEAYNNLAGIYLDNGDYALAEKYTRKAIEIDKNFAMAYTNLGNILTILGKKEEAEKILLKSIELDPNCPTAHSNLGAIRERQGKDIEARKLFKKASLLAPENLSFKINSALYLSSVPFSNKHIESERKEYVKQISLLNENKDLIFKGQIFTTSMFYLAYHNKQDDKNILMKLSQVLSSKNGIVNRNFNKNKQLLNYKKRKNIRLGVCSDYLYQHSVSNFFGNIIKDIATAGIEVFIFRGPNAREDSHSKSIDELATEVIRMPACIQSSCDLILSRSIDILFYVDLGMSNYTYLLSLSRLALVQFTTLGHPNTSGSNEIDYFISCDDYETNNSESFYSENLIKLSRIPVNYTMPKINITKTKFKLESLNIPDSSFLIGIPHSPFKFHPDYDLVLDKILEEIPHALFFFADGIKKNETLQLKERWKNNTKLILQKTIFFPRVSLNEFFQIIKDLDIILDPFYFGMGNTFYQSMCFNTPVVTMPTNHIKSRHAFAGYKQMGIKNPPIASSPSEYVSICKKLAFDHSYRNNLKSQINDESRSRIFNDQNIYQEYIEFFNASLDAAKSDKLLPTNWQPKLNKNNLRES